MSQKFTAKSKQNLINTPPNRNALTTVQSEVHVACLQFQLVLFKHCGEGWEPKNSDKLAWQAIFLGWLGQSVFFGRVNSAGLCSKVQALLKMEFCSFEMFIFFRTEKSCYFFKKICFFSRFQIWIIEWCFEIRNYFMILLCIF